MSEEDYDDDDEHVMSEDKAQARAAALKMLAGAAEKFFAKHPSYQSMLLGVAQYWADEADDAVHYDLVASERPLPLWPHYCEETAWDQDDFENVPGEVCWNCGELGYLGAWDDNGSSITAFESFCHEVGSQEEPSAHNYLPFAVARKVGERIEVEVIGKLQRPDNETDGDVTAIRDWLWADPRGRELFDIVAANPTDDGARRVCADYMMENDDPRGEYIALSLDGREPERCAALLAEHGNGWVQPLLYVLPACTLKWARGFPVAAEVFAGESDIARVRGAAAWGTFERLHVHRGSECVLDPAMRSLRELGPIDATWIDALAGAARPWAIEALEIELGAERDVAKLCATTTLPKLRSLTISAGHLDGVVAQLTKAVWWKQLERLTVVVDAEDDYAKWAGRHRELGVPWLAIVRSFEEPATAKGWEVAYGPNDACEITLRGWTPHASIDALGELLQKIPAPAGYKLVASEYYVPSPVDMERIAPSQTGN